jgi:response regulator RpfG family c-di-GMP phosphodiesterase
VAADQGVRTGSLRAGSRRPSPRRAACPNRWRRQQPGLNRIPVVVLTSSRESDDIRRPYDAGANSYLVKPVQFDALLERVKALGTFWLILNEPPPSCDS